MDDALILNSDGGPIFFQFPSLLEFPELFHGIFTRNGGVSREPFESLNVGLRVGDSPKSVAENRRRMMARCDGLSPVFLHQVHGTRVQTVQPVSMGTVNNRHSAAPEADAAVTNVPGLALGIQVADCQSVILYDPETRTVANVHAGWRGSIGNILGETVASMRTAYGSWPKDLHAAIGPSLGPCCAEFIHFEKEIPRKYWSYKDERHHFDFWAISRDQLAAAGVKEKNIAVSGLCTRCRSDLFFSYRGEKTTGRFATLAGLRKTVDG